jgi:hypothetical protein
MATLVRAVATDAPAQALAISDSVRAVLAVNQPPDPFAGTLFHLLRGEWYAARQDPRAAEREWRWYEGSDFRGWPAGPAQAGEIGAAFGVYARARLAALRLRSATSAADTTAACALVRRVADLWRDAEAAAAATRDSLVRSGASCLR